MLSCFGWNRRLVLIGMTIFLWIGLSGCQTQTQKWGDGIFLPAITVGGHESQDALNRATRVASSTETRPMPTVTVTFPTATTTALPTSTATETPTLLLAKTPTNRPTAMPTPTSSPTQVPTQVPTALPVPTATPRCTAKDPSSIFGVQMYGQTSPWNPWYSSLEKSGAKWVRIPVEWKTVEPENVTPDHFTWQKSDGAFFAAQSGCYNVIATHSAAPAWAATFEQGPLDTTTLDELQEYIGAAVERYDGDGFQDAPGSPVVNYWEIYNEPDAGQPPDYPGWGQVGDEYAEMLQAIYPVIKAANPNAKVLLGGLAYEWFEEDGGPFIESFLDDVLAAGGGDYFDIMNFHSFAAEFTPRYPAPGLWEKTNHIRGILAAHGIEKPVVVTESGWRSNNGSTPERQARYITAFYAQAIAADLEILVHWMLWDPPYKQIAGAAGLVTNDPKNIEEKPAFFAYQVAVGLLEGVQFVRKLPQSELQVQEMEAYEFIDPATNRGLYVAWLNPLADEEPKTELPQVAIPASKVTLRDIYGTPREVLDGDDGVVDGIVAVPVSHQPVYVIVIE